MSPLNEILPLYRSILHQARLLSHTWSDQTLLRSHAYLARRNLEPLLSQQSRSRDHVIATKREVASRSQPAIAADPSLQDDVSVGAGLDVSWPPPTEQKRLKRARMHLRHLADANVGWPHAVERAIELAYARRGKLRRDALALLSPQPAPLPGQQRLPRRLQPRALHPVLAQLLVTPETVRGTAARPQHLQRVPPPYLLAEDDPLITKFGKHIGARRMANAWRKWFRLQMKKVVVPVDVVTAANSQGQGENEGGEGGQRYRDLEARAACSHPSLPRRARAGAGAGVEARDTTSAAAAAVGGGGGEAAVAAYLRRAQREVARFSSEVRAQAMRKPSQRSQGWERAPKDYAARGRARRRLYARLLEKSPVLVVSGRGSGAEAEEKRAHEGRVHGRDPLGLRKQLRNAMEQLAEARAGGGGGLKLGIKVSEHATRKRGARGAPRDSAERLTEQEMGFLQRAGVV
ncbi:hypothetical protein ACQY0O_007485 [Thecaphora frezii]